MSRLILSPENLYPLFSFVLFAFGNVAFTNIFHAKYLKQKMKLLEVNCLVKFFIIILGWTVTSIVPLISFNFLSLVFCFLAPIFALAFVPFEKKLQRSLILKVPIQILSNTSRSSSLTKKDLGMTAKKIEDKKNTRNIKFSSKIYEISLLGLLFSAVTEEVIFRGQLFSLANSMRPEFAAIGSILILNSLFSLLHLNFGWVNVFSKFLFGIIASFFVVLSHSIFPAILFHGTFNFIAWLEYKNHDGLINIHHLREKFMSRN